MENLNNPEESRSKLVLIAQWSQKYFSHIIQCLDANCRLPRCYEMKNVVHHAKSCRKKTNERCEPCKIYNILRGYHVKHCQEAKCTVPSCININIKNKFGQHQRLQKAQILKSRIATMQNHGMSCAVLQPSPGTSNSFCQPSYSFQHHPPQPGLDIEPSSGPPVGAFKSVQQVHYAATRQNVPQMSASNYVKGHPVINRVTANAELMAPSQQMQSMSQMMPGIPNRMLYTCNVTSWKNSVYVQNQQPHQNTQLFPNPQLGLQQPSQIMGGPNSMPNHLINSIGPLQVIPNSGPSIAGTNRPTQANVWNEQQQQQQQHLISMQKQQQQPNPLAHPQPPMHSQLPHMPVHMNFGHQQGFQGDGSQFPFQQQTQQFMQPQIKQMASPIHPHVSH